MSITYEEALGTLEAMFGTPWTRESLDAVLRHFQGHMENTVESILHYGDGDPASHIKELKNGTNTDIIRMDEELAMQLAKEERTKPSSYVAASAPAAPNKKQGRGPVVELPADFLRVPGFSGSSGAADSFTVGGDEALARMLQDELFSQELANNPEFAHLAQGRPRTVGGRPTNHPALNDTVGEFSGGDVKRHGDDGHNLMEKVAGKSCCLKTLRGFPSLPNLTHINAHSFSFYRNG